MCFLAGQRRARTAVVCVVPPLFYDGWISCRRTWWLCRGGFSERHTDTWCASRGRSCTAWRRASWVVSVFIMTAVLGFESTLRSQRLKRSVIPS